MNRLRGLVAVLTLIFLLSGVSLLLLIIDDQKDLSSRASFVATNLPAKPAIAFPQTEPELSYDSNIWLKIENGFYLNQNSGDTLRIYKENFNSSSISGVLGKEFTNRKLLGADQVSLQKWKAEKYTFDLFGETKKVNLWKNEKLSVLEVGKVKSSSTDTLLFLSTVLESKAVLGASTGPDDSAKLATLVRPSIAMVLNHYCAELKFFNAPDFPLSDKVYPYCLTSMGSGFFISGSGVVATNGHIVKNLPKSALYYGISSGKLDTLLSDFLGVYFSQINKRTYTSEEITQKVKESHANKEVLYQVGGLIADLNQKNILKFQNEKNSYYLQIGNQGAEITNEGVKESDGVIKAVLLGVDYQEPKEQVGFTSSDVALLKAEKGIFPALPLGTVDEAVVGSNLQVVGFPAVAISSNNLLDSSAVSEPTFTKGVVSAIKLAKGNQKKLIQTDAIINHGNSGGPALLMSGRVVGVATYGVTAEDGGSSYNFLRDIQDVKDLAANQNINLDQSEIFTLWSEGLKNYWLGYFKYSSEKFTKLKTIYPLHPMVDKYLEVSDTKIGTVEDLTPKFSHSKRSFLIYLSGASMAISLLSIIIIAFLISAQKQKKQELPQAPTF